MVFEVRFDDVRVRESEGRECYKEQEH